MVTGLLEGGRVSKRVFQVLNVRERNEVSIGSGYSQKVPLWQMFRKHTPYCVAII